MVAEIIEPKSKVKVKNNDVIININGVAHITQTGKNITLDNISQKDEIENRFEETIKERIYSLFEEKSKEKVDIFGIGNVLYRKKNSLFNDENYLDKVNLIVNVNLDIVNTGGIKKAW